MRKRKPETQTKAQTPITLAQKAARRQNLLKFRSSVGGKTALKHGIGALARTGQLPPVPGATEIKELVSASIDAAINDLGGPSMITESQKHILESSRLALTIVGLGARYLSAEGIVDARSRKPHGLLTVLATYCNVLRLNSQALGLERRAKDANTLDAVLSEYSEKEASHAKAD